MFNHAMLGWEPGAQLWVAGILRLEAIPLQPP